MIALRAELEVLATCAAPQFDEARLESALKRKIDWEWLNAAAGAHGMAALTSVRLEGGDVPATALEGIRATARNATARNLRLSATLAQFVRALDAAGIEVILFKGAVVAQRLYGSLSERPSCDADVLVRPEDVPDAIHAGHSVGLVDGDAEPPLDAMPLGGKKHRQLLRGDGSLLEIHWALQDTDEIAFPELDDVWKFATRLDGFPANVRTLDENHTLAHLAVHGTTHGWTRLSWVSDIARAAAQPHVDCSWLLEAATRAHARRSILLGFALARDVLKSPPPPPLLAALDDDSTIQRLTSRVLCSWNTAPRPLLPRFPRLAFRLVACDSKLDQARHLSRVLLRPTDGERNAFPLVSSNRFALGALRPLRILSRIARR